MFKLSNTGVLSTLATFNGSSVGRTPTGALLMDAAGNLFGTTLNGGASNYGTVFELPKNGTLNTLATLCGQMGMEPYAGLTADAQGKLYGTAVEGRRQLPGHHL